MIDTAALASLKSWFDGYVLSFDSDDPEFRQALQIKVCHIQCVCREIVAIGKNLQLSVADLAMAETTALFHDVGRFEQFRRYGTFVDFKSENHAALGVRILKENRVLDKVDESEADLVYRVILNHNRISLPEGEAEPCLTFSRMLRDADKLDILRVVTDYYANPPKTRNRAIELDLPDTPVISGEICDDLLAGRSARMTDMRSLNDFKLLQMGWVYDVNFPHTLQQIRERKYLEKIREALPRPEQVSEVYTVVRKYLEKMSESPVRTDSGSR